MIEKDFAFDRLKHELSKTVTLEQTEEAKKAEYIKERWLASKAEKEERLKKENYACFKDLF